MSILARVPLSLRRLAMVLLAGGTGISCGTSSGVGPPAAGVPVGPAGGSATSVDGLATVTVPAGALDTTLAITVAPAAGAPIGAAGPAYDYGPDGTTFGLPVTLRLPFDPAALPAGVSASQLRLGHAVGGVWTEVPGSVVDEAAHWVSGPTSSFSTYAAIVPGLAILPPPDDGFGDVTLTAYVVDTPAAGSANEFRELQPAIEWLHANLAATERGRIVIRTTRRLAGGSFNLTRAIRIEPETDDRDVTIDGPSTFTSPGDLSLAGLTIGGLTTVNADGQVTLFGDQFGGAVNVNLGLGGAGRAGRSEARGADVRNCTAAADLTVDAVAEVSGDVVVAGTTAPAVNLLGTFAGSAEAKVSGCPTDTVRFDAELKASAKGRLESLSGLDLVDARLKAQGTNTFEAEEVVTGELKLAVEDAGQLTVRARSVTSQKAVYELGASKVDVSAENTVAGEVSWAGGSADGVRAEVTIDEHGGRAEAAAKLVSHANADVTLTVRNFDFKDKVDIIGDGETHADLTDDVRVGANLTAVLKDVSTVGLDSGRYEAGVFIEAKDTARLSLSAKGSIHHGTVGVFPADGAFVDVAITDQAVMQAGGFIVDSAGSVADALGGLFRVRTIEPSTAQRRRPARPAGRRQDGSQIVVRNVQFTAPGNLPPICLFGVEGIPVTIESNEVNAASVFAMVISEVNAPVTIRGNQCLGGGLGLDGDLEGEGRSGPIAQPCLVENNTIQAAAGQGVTVQDLTDVTLRGNHVTGLQGVAVSAGTARLASNTIEAELALSVAQAGGGTTLVRLTDGNQVSGAALVGPGGFLNAEGNTIAGSIAPFPGGYIRLVGNNLAGSQVGDSLTGGLLTDPLTANTGLTEDDLATAIDFNGNGCQDHPADCDGPDPDSCCPGIPMPQPALPLGF